MSQPDSENQFKTFLKTEEMKSENYSYHTIRSGKENISSQ